MLDRFVKLADDGTFTKSTPHAKKLTYGGMLNLRAQMVGGAHRLVGQMGTITARYSFKRRQFTGRDGEAYPEALVIQYQMQQYKIVPTITYSWMILLASTTMLQMYDQYNRELALMERGEKADPFVVLKDLHGIVAGFKALTTWDGEKYSEILKQACGGHGYMQISGLHKLHVDFGFAWQMTEGDNTVMAQQTSRYLLAKVQSGEITLDHFEFDLATQKLDTDQELLLLYEMRYKNELTRVALQMQSAEGSTSDKWNSQSLVYLVSTTVYFCEYWALKNFYELIKGQRDLYAINHGLNGKLTDKSASLQQLMHLMFRNQAFYNLHEQTVSFFKNMTQNDARQYFNMAKLETFKKTFKKELEVLAMSLPDICDGYMFDDDELLSVIGKRSHKNDGEMYEEMLDVVRNNPINKRTVAKGIAEHIRPLVLAKL